ncbi:sugar phosphate nucleotidyltransferase [Novipirellula artificiosorum]|uniref:UTP--glucose-1-phosphate uridylyltransferase n=1 Tax=Novipirellula artificiosorum TaxID=2528016 RepID=A0A5C6DC55_9BACT|nr:sugar phosphate nucleotidyltransferase [Novipirellula artificiosorum]TWU33795.1 UTP--glucose-1-phosphate uridylyltransferase [Novipirellula artificiosorum]
MQVQKAVITAAAPNQNTLPLQQLVDRKGEVKTALQLVVEETTAAGVEEICVVIRPGDQDAYEQAAGTHLGSIVFVEQSEPNGYADAIHQAKSFVGDDPFLHLVGDHLYLTSAAVPCARQLIQVANEFECSVSAVQSTRENKLPYFGIVSGPLIPRRSDVYEVERVVEKPTPTFAEQELVTPGLRSGHYLGFFGMHVLTSQVMAAIEQLLAEGGRPKATLSDALAILSSRQRYLAYKVHGSRYNLGLTYGLLNAQLAIGLSGKDRDQILTELVDLLASRTEEERAK